MTVPADDSAGAQDQDWAAFASLDRMVDHWDRPGWHPGRSAYYWYLSFRDQPTVRAMALECKPAVAGQHFDPVPVSDLHMTVERVGFTDDISGGECENITELATGALRGFGLPDLTIGPLAGSNGAISFSASPRKHLTELRRRLVLATRAAGFATDVPIDSLFRPHVGIGYCNRPIDAAPIIERVRRLRALPPVTVHVSEVLLVELTRHERAYSWTVAHRLPLAIVN